MEWPRFLNKLSGGIYLLPDVPQQNSAHPAIFEVIDNPFSKGRFPVRKRLESRIQLADGFISEVKEIGIEKWQMAVRFRFSRHIASGELAHRICIILMLDANVLLQRRVIKRRHITGSVNCRICRLEQFIDDNSVVLSSTLGS